MAKRNDVVDVREAQRRQLEAAYKATPAINTKHYDAAFLRSEFLRVALIAAIPPDNLNAFLAHVADCVHMLEAMVEGDRIRDERRVAMRGFVSAADKMIYAMERIHKYEKPEISGAGDMVFTVAFRLNGHRQAGSPSLSDMKGELVGLRDQAALMLVELPKRGRNRTSLFLRNLWLAARKHGGKLTYDPKTERGTLTEVIEFFSELNGVNTKLSPSTLDRIGKAVRRQTLTEVTEFFTIVDSIDRPD